MTSATAQKPFTGEIILSEKQSEAEYYLEDDTTTEVLFASGAGPGKSFFGCAWQIKRRLLYPETVGLIGRKKLKDLKDTTLVTFWRVAKRMGLKEGVHFQYKEQAGRILFPKNDSMIFLRGLMDMPSDVDFGDIGSLELSDAFIDQAEQISRKALNAVNSRVRYNCIRGLRKTLLTANPANNWLKFRHVLDKNNQPIVQHPKRKFVKALLDSNPDKEFVRQYTETLLDLDEYDRNRLLYGDWTGIENDRPFFDLFNEKRNVSKFALKIDPYSPLWLSFDFNLNPTTCIVSQQLPNVGCRTYDCLEAIGTGALSWRVKELYGKHPAGLLVCGDHSGGSGSSSAGILPGGVYNTDFEQIKTILGLTGQDLIDTKTANARHEYSRRLCRHFLSKVPFLIDGTNERCQGLRSDLQNAKFINGRLYKNRADGNEMDYADAYRYWVNAMFAGDFSIIEDYANSLG